MARPFSDVIRPAQSAVVDDHRVEQYIIFSIDQQEYGVSVSVVREIRGWIPEKRLPNLPLYVRGVINLRGTVIPIVDLRARFGDGATETTKTHVVIIIESGDSLKGLLVDAILDILPIPHTQIKPAPDMAGEALDAHYLDGLYTPEDRIIALLGVSAYAEPTGMLECHPVSPSKGTDP